MLQLKPIPNLNISIILSKIEINRNNAILFKQQEFLDDPTFGILSLCKFMCKFKFHENFKFPLTLPLETLLSTFQENLKRLLPLKTKTAT